MMTNLPATILDKFNEQLRASGLFDAELLSKLNELLVREKKVKAEELVALLTPSKEKTS